MKFIDALKLNEIIVFGSNKGGLHHGGLARECVELWGAQYGVGEGLTGFCYAFPTLGYRFEELKLEDLEESRDLFYRCALANPDRLFLLTKIGTGIAGIEEAEMKKLFTTAPINVIKPKGW